MSAGLAAALTLASCSSTAGDSADTSAAPASTTTTSSVQGGASTTSDAAETSAPAGDTTEAATASSLPFEAASGDVRGFDGTTIKLAGLGAANLSDAQIGAQARVEQFNADNEIPGIKLEFTEYADDKQDPATALSEARRLVTQEKVFAIVSDASTVNPKDFLVQQKVPYFGAGYDNTFCSEEVNPDTWAFGNGGCLLPDDPKEMPDSGGQLYSYLTEKLGKPNPTVAIFSSENTSGQIAAKTQAAAFTGAGFDVKYAKGILPTSAISDYTPYVQTLISSADGGQPDLILCLVSTDCVGVYQGLLNAGFTGAYQHSLYLDLFLAPMKGALALAPWAPADDPAASAGLEKINGAIEAVKPDATLGFFTAIGYFSTDMFISALKTVAAAGTEYITPENVRLAAANQSWGIDKVIGPLRYPDATVMSTPRCSALVTSDGTKWTTLVPYECSEKRYQVDG